VLDLKNIRKSPWMCLCLYVELVFSIFVFNKQYYVLPGSVHATKVVRHFLNFTKSRTVVDQNEMGQSKFRLCNSIFLQNPSLRKQKCQEFKKKI
jgi:hypothetical protein